MPPTIGLQDTEGLLARLAEASNLVGYYLNRLYLRELSCLTLTLNATICYVHESFHVKQIGDGARTAP